MKQHELFTSLTGPHAEKGKRLPIPNDPEEKFEIRLTLDKVIFAGLASLIFLIIVFTFGVEHGKSIQKDIFQNQREIESITNLARVTAAQKALIAKPADDSSRDLNKKIQTIEETGEKEFKKKGLLGRLLFFLRKDPPPSALKVQPQASEYLKKEAPLDPGVDEVIEPEVVQEASKKPLEPSTIKDGESSETQDKKPVESTDQKLDENQAFPSEWEKAYEVRIMSLVKRAYAEKEVTALRTKGLEVSFRKSGDYYLVILGPYPSRGEADRFLEEARKLSPFKDAYIRRLA